MKEIKSGRWNYQLKCGKALRDAIHDENPGEILEMIMKAYQELLDNDMIDESTYYFTYEGEEITNWTFGGTFPIILGGEGLGTLPITLT